MKSKNIIFVLTVLSCLLMPFLSFAQKSSRGGNSGSGGGLYAEDASGRRALLDVFNFAPDLLEGVKTSGIKIPETRSLKAWGVDTFSIRDLYLEDELLSRVSSWRKSSPIITSRLIQAIKRVKIYVLGHPFGPILEEGNQTYIVNKNVILARPIAVYIKDYGFFLSRDAFESLDQQNQIAFLIHECLRHVQISYGFDISEEKLQQITIRILRGHEVNKSLDTQEYLGNIAIKTRGSSEIANQLAEISSMILSLRLKSYSNLSPTAARALEDLEFQADLLVSTVRSSGLPLSFSDQLLDFTSHFLKIKKNYSIPETVYEGLAAIETRSRSVVDRAITRDIYNIVDDATDSAIALNNILGLEMITKDINQKGWWRSDYRIVAQDVLIKMKEMGIIL